MMNPEMKSRWVSKLREEDRYQGLNCMRDEFGAQCCLDVGAEIPVEDGIIDPPILILDGAELDQYNYFWFDESDVWDDPDFEFYDKDKKWNRAEYETLPEPAWKYLGLERSNPEVNVSQETLDRLDEGYMRHPGRYDLVTINDDWHLPFHEIAIVIEDDPEL